MLDTALNWDKEPKKAPEFLAILDDISADGSFLVFEFLKRYLPKFGVTLVTLSRPSTHYAQVSRKVFVDLQAMVNEHKDMEDLYNAMIESSKSSSRPCIILDCLSFLLYNGYSLKSIVMLVTKLAHYIIAAQGTLIVFAHNDSADDKDQLMMCDWLRYEAHSVINVAPLASGVSEGISGQMEISVNKKKSLLLYKQHDTGVSIFARGIF